MKGIIGIGNLLKGDDGIGVLLVQKIKERELPPNVRVYDAGTDEMKVLHILKDLDEAIIVDAVHFGGEPGEHLFFEPGEVRSLRRPKSSHNANLLEVLELSKQIKEAPNKITIMGIEPKNTFMNESFSRELRKKLPEFTDKLYKKVKTMMTGRNSQNHRTV